MSVVSVRELFDGRDGSLKGREISDLRIFRVTTDDPTDGHVAILTSGFLPEYGSLHPFSPLLRAYDISWKQQSGTAYHWIFTFEYGNHPPQARQKPDIDPDPTKRRAIFRFKGVQGKRLLTKAFRFPFATIAQFDKGNGAGTLSENLMPVWSSTFERFENVEVDEAKLIIEVEYNVGPFDIPDYVFDYVNVMNSAPVTIVGRLFPAYTLKMSVPDISDLKSENEGTDFQVDYYTIKLSINYKKETWFEPQLDRGFKKWSSTDMQYIDIVTADGTKPTTPMNLDGAGNLLNSQNPDDAMFAWYVPYEPVDFGILPL